MRDHESFLARLQETLSRWTGRSARRGSEPVGGRPRLGALRREIARARRAAAESARADLARARAGLEDFGHDYGVPRAHSAFTRAELEAFRRHVRTTARLLGDLSNADSPAWDRAHEEYERSWTELERIIEPERRPPSPR